MTSVTTKLLKALVIGPLFFLFLFTSSISPYAAECMNRGDLDTRYCDENGDLVADTPKDKSKWLDPSVLIFSYTPVEDPAVYENVLTDFMDYMAKKTGKKVKWYGDSPNDAPMFGFFPHTVGVANVRKFRKPLSHQPAYVTTRPCGAGFRELADLLLSTR